MVHATVEDSSLEGDTEFQCVLSVPGTSYTEERSITYSSGEFSGQDGFVYLDGAGQQCHHVVCESLILLCESDQYSSCSVLRDRE